MIIPFLTGLFLVNERTLGGYSNLTVRVTFKALHIGELDYDVELQNRNDANNTAHIKVCNRKKKTGRGGRERGKRKEERGEGESGEEIMRWPSWAQQSVRSPASPCSSRTPVVGSSRGSGTRGAQACDAEQGRG